MGISRVPFKLLFQCNNNNNRYAEENFEGKLVKYDKLRRKKLFQMPSLLGISQITMKDFENAVERIKPVQITNAKELYLLLVYSY